MKLLNLKEQNLINNIKLNKINILVIVQKGTILLKSFDSLTT